MTPARALLLALTLAAAPAAARVTEINIASVEPFATGAAFGDAGAYERVKGTFRGELDPADPRNRVIVNLDKAPRNAAGKVEYRGGLLHAAPGGPGARQPQDPLRRHQPRPRRHQQPVDGCPLRLARRDQRSAHAAGRRQRLPLRQGYTFVWSGWDAERPARQRRPGDEAGDRDERRRADRAGDPRGVRERHARARAARRAERSACPSA